MESKTSDTTGFESEVLRLADQASAGCVDFLRDLVTIPSPSRGERLACERVQREMEELGYEDVHIDEMGNVLGRLGNGPRVLAIDAHLDTVGITDPHRWKYDPFRGIVSGGILYGRGASDQKGGLAAAIHGLALSRQIGLPEDVTVWVTATVSGEECVGLAWEHLIQEEDLHPEVVVIAMPSHLGICRGQRGRMELRLTTIGVATHGSIPDRGTNAIYRMLPVVQALARLHGELEVDHALLGSGSVAVTNIASRSAALTAIPDECTIHVDRRVTIGEGRESAMAQITALPELDAAEATVELVDYDQSTWRGLRCVTEKFFPAWETPAESVSVRAAMDCARTVLGREPRLHRSAFSSNGCSISGRFGIPTVGFGPADEVHSHSTNDQIPLAQLSPAMAFYALYPQIYVGQNASTGQESSTIAR